MIFFTKKSVWL